jgi:hypothetical protein
MGQPCEFQVTVAAEPVFTQNPSFAPTVDAQWAAEAFFTPPGIQLYVLPRKSVRKRTGRRTNDCSAHD